MNDQVLNLFSFLMADADDHLVEKALTHVRVRKSSARR
jgi:hypothetical protein